MDKEPKRVDDARTANDVSQWGEAQELKYGEPFEIAGEAVDLDALPAFGEDDLTAERPREVITKLTDVGEWGDKECHSGMYSEPFMVAGEAVDIDSLPEFGDSDKPEAGER